MTYDEDKGPATVSNENNEGSREDQEVDFVELAKAIVILSIAVPALEILDRVHHFLLKRWQRRAMSNREVEEVSPRGAGES